MHALLPVFAAWFVAGSLVASGAEVAPASGYLFEAAASVPTMSVVLSDQHAAKLSREPRSYVRADVTFGSTVLRDLALRLKGHATFQPVSQKPSFAIKFDQFVPGQQAFGVRKILLNNAGHDPTYLADIMGTSMFRDAGVPVSRVSHARVSLNGRDLGLYICVEAQDKQFLKHWFGNKDGNLYEGAHQDVDQVLDQDNGADTSQSDLQKLVAAASELDEHLRWNKLNAILDVDHYISYLVCEIFTSHADGYASNRNNYRLYADPRTGRFTFIAHGLDWSFRDARMSIDPPQQSLITKAVLTTPQGKALYHERLQTLFTNIFKLEVLTKRVNEATARMVTLARDANEVTQFRACGEVMNRRIIARHQHVSGLIAGTRHGELGHPAKVIIE